jgi:hypothetical protein
MKSPIQSIRISVKTANTLEQFMATHTVSPADSVSLVVRPSSKHKGVIRGNSEDLHLFATLVMTSAEATDAQGRSALKKETQERLRAAARELLCAVIPSESVNIQWQEDAVVEVSLPLTPASVEEKSAPACFAVYTQMYGEPAVLHSTHANQERAIMQWSTIQGPDLAWVESVEESAPAVEEEEERTLLSPEEVWEYAMEERAVEELDQRVRAHMGSYAAALSADVQRVRAVRELDQRVRTLCPESLRALLPRVVFSNISPMVELLAPDTVMDCCISEEEHRKLHTEDCSDWEDCDCDYREPLSFYLVEQSFSDMLREQGELIYDFNGVLVWGRETFGQLLEEDVVVRRALYKLFPQELSSVKEPQVTSPARHHIPLENLPSLLASGVWGVELACSAYKGTRGDALLVIHMGSYAASLSADVDLWCSRIRYLLELTDSTAPQWRAVLLPLLAVELSPQDQDKVKSALINRVLSGVEKLNESYPVNEWGTPYAFEMYCSLSQMVCDLLQHIARTC